MHDFVTRKNSNSRATTSSEQALINQQKARELYMQPPSLNEKTIAPAKKLTTSHSRESSRDPSPGYEHDVFSTDASIRDDTSSINGSEDFELLKGSVYGKPLSRTPMELVDQHFRPASRGQRSQKEGRLSKPKSKDQNRPETPSSYPSTTPNGSHHGGEERALLDFATPANNVAPQNKQLPMLPASPSSGATGGSTHKADSTLPPARGAPSSRITIVRGPFMTSPEVNGNAVLRPSVSHNPKISGPGDVPVSVSMNVLPSQHPLTKTSTLGDVSSDPESSPSPVDHDALDYPPEQLKTMDFSALRNESVDHSHTLSSSGELELQLANALKTGNREIQQTLLESLNLDQWAEAGAWFAARQADLSSHWVKLRREKRSLALALEEEISTRHEKVIEERRALEQQLRDLEDAGRKTILAGTPKKRKA